MDSVFCGGCGKKYKAGPEMAGKRLRCKACGGVVTVPAAGAAAAVPPPLPTGPMMKPAAARRPATVAAAVPVEVGGGDIDFDALASLEASGTVDASAPMGLAPLARSTARPARQTIARPGSKPLANGRGNAGRATTGGAVLGGFLGRGRVGLFRIRLILGLVVGGIALAIAGGRQLLLASHASASAKQMTCAELAAGYGDNAHVKLVEAHALPYSVHAFNPASPNVWTAVYVPVVSPDDAKAANRQGLGRPKEQLLAAVSGQVHVLIKSTAAQSESDVESLRRQTEFEGLVVNDVESLTQKEQDLLSNRFPAMDVAHCQILEIGREPAGGKGLLFVGGGVLMTLAGIGVLLKPAA